MEGAASNESKIDDDVSFDVVFFVGLVTDLLLFSSFSSSLYSGSAINRTRMDGISIPHRLNALETSKADVHRTRFLGLNLFNNVGLEQKLMILFAF